MRARRFGVTVAVVVAAMGMGIPAHAVGEDGVGNAGAAGVPGSNGQVTPVGPLADCDVYGAESASSPALIQSGAVRYGASSSTCVRDDNTERNTVKVLGASFQLDAFTTSNRQKIRTGEYTMTCDGIPGKTNAQFTIRNIRGVTAPNPIPANAEVWVNGTLHGAAAKAKVVFRETLFDGQGGIDMTAMHVYLYRADVLVGHAAIGRASCSPYS